MADCLRPAPPGHVRLEGPVGEELDRIVRARILSPEAGNRILPEAERAFSDRVDDAERPKRGGWQGEFWGKWICGAVAAQRYTGDPTLRERIAESVAAVLQTQRPDGYIGTYEDSGFVVGNCWNVWCRKYTLWGLVEAFDLLRDPAILAAAEALADHLMTEVGPGAVDIVRTGNFAGLPSSSILTPVLRLYSLSGADRFPDYARSVVAAWGAHPGAPPDIVNRGLEGKPVCEWFPEAGAWTKAYEFISCVEGLLDLFRIDPRPEYLAAVRNIHAVVRDNERVITGGIGYHDKLAGAAFRTDGLNEPCDVVYWERLNASLLALTGEPEYADEIERLTWNVLMAAANRDGTWALRRLGLSEPHLIAPLHCMLRHHQCCVANLPRGFLQLAEVAVMAGDSDALAVNLLLPLEARVPFADGTPRTLRITSQGPTAPETELTLRIPAPREFELRVRLPAGAQQTAVAVNGEAAPDGQPGTFLRIRRRWGDGDRVTVTRDVAPRARKLGAGGTTAVAVQAGPVVLARCSLLEDGDVHSPVALPINPDGTVRLNPVRPPPGVRIAYEGRTATGTTVRLCDYASTGKDFAKPADPADWRAMLDNRTAHDLRVWLPTESPA